MKRIICLLCALLLLPLTACTGEKTDPTDAPSESVPPVSAAPETPSAEPSQEPVYTGPYHPLTGVPCEEDLSGRRPVAVMLNNLMAALPQQGNSQADIIYECLAEGGITRMMGIYLEPEQVGLIGSVRSARQYYWELAKGHDAMFVHAGGSPEFYETKSSLSLFTVDGVNGVYSGNGTFWRDRNRIEGKYYAVEHSLLTSGETIAQVRTSKGLDEHTAGYAYEMAFANDAVPADGQDAATVTVSFSGYKTGVFRYDADLGAYLAEEYGEPYIDGNDGAQVSVANVLVLRTTYTVLDDYGRVRMDLSSGEGWFACGGKMAPITWKKGGAGEQLRFFTADGAPLTLSRGRSYVCFIPAGRSVTAE